jgi:ascorbate-specific PTS system EIIC-type component UlaA
MMRSEGHSVSSVFRKGWLGVPKPWRQGDTILHLGAFVKLFFCASAQAGVFTPSFSGWGGLMYASQKFTGTLALVTPGTVRV